MWAITMVQRDRLERLLQSTVAVDDRGSHGKAGKRSMAFGAALREDGGLGDVHLVGEIMKMTTIIIVPNDHQAAWH